MEFPEYSTTFWTEYMTEHNTSLHCLHTCMWMDVLPLLTLGITGKEQLRETMRDD